MDTARLLHEVTRVAQGLHTAGTFSAAVLQAIVRHTEAPVAHSAETGSGASTLLFSHMSADHTVFALDAGTNSVRGVQSSPLLRRDTVTFVEGPTQVTLPQHAFRELLSLALIDGPHGYPFPDLEYYYLYPHLAPHALLIVDDIHIPTITNLFEFLVADEMFELREVVETTAFFRRTTAPTFPPTGDGWWEQRYNKRAFESLAAEPVVGTHAEAGQSTHWYLDQLGPVTDPLRAGRLQVVRGDLGLSGWAIDGETRRPAEAVEFLLDGSAYRTPVRTPRGDVAAAHGSHAYFRCGFNTWLAASTMAPGPHTLQIRIVLSGGRIYTPGVTLRFDVV